MSPLQWGGWVEGCNLEHTSSSTAILKGLTAGPNYRAAGEMGAEWGAEAAGGGGVTRRGDTTVPKSHISKHASTYYSRCTLRIPDEQR